MEGSKHKNFKMKNQGRAKKLGVWLRIGSVRK